VECKRADQKHKRSLSTSQNPENRHPLGVRTQIYGTNYVKIPTYTTYAANDADGRAHAGSAIIITEEIKNYELAKYETDHIQATNISIED
jgi:hypothetical protein